MKIIDVVKDWGNEDDTVKLKTLTYNPELTEITKLDKTAIQLGTNFFVSEYRLDNGYIRFKEFGDDTEIISRLEGSNAVIEFDVYHIKTIEHMSDNYGRYAVYLYECLWFINQVELKVTDKVNIDAAYPGLNFNIGFNYTQIKRNKIYDHISDNIDDYITSSERRPLTLKCWNDFITKVKLNNFIDETKD